MVAVEKLIDRVIFKFNSILKLRKKNSIPHVLLEEDFGIFYSNVLFYK